MKRFKNLSWLFIAVFLCCPGGWGNENAGIPSCRSYTLLSEQLQSLQAQYAPLVHLSSLAESAEGRSVWIAEIGRGTDDDLRIRPAMLVIAGVEGNQLAGTDAALAFIQKICNGTDAVQTLLDTVTLFVIPRLNPDAAESFFQKPRREQLGNLNPFDADHDGLIDEDGPDDLNDDGLISWIRIEDTKGNLIQHPDESRILIEADPAKGEEGKWLLFSEGKDNDRDEKINEDGPGEVNFNKNFPYGYTFFDADAGIYPCSEKETRALAEFIIDHPNIAVVMTFGNQGSLLKTPESGDSSGGRTPQSKPRQEDAKYYDFLGEQYREQMGIDKTVDTPNANGAFPDWIYFHRGRLSLSTPIWSADIALALKKKEEKKDEKKDQPPENESLEKTDSTSDTSIKDATPEQPSEDSADSKKETKDKSDGKNDEKKEDKKKEDKRGQSDIEYLKWVEENAPDYFLPWTPIEHPDYPGQKAEIGGFSPFAKVLPPANRFDAIIDKNASFLVWLAGKLPHIEIHKVEIEDLGNGVFDVCLTVRNSGYLPTVLAHGQRTGEVFPTRIELDIPKDKILAGEAMSHIGNLEGSGGLQEVRWVLQANTGDTVKVRVISALGGQVEQTIELKGKGE